MSMSYQKIIKIEHTWLRQINVINAIKGAAIENTNKCFFILGRSNPLCNRNDTKPKAAGAWNYAKYKKKSIIWECAWDTKMIHINFIICNKPWHKFVKEKNLVQRLILGR